MKELSIEEKAKAYDEAYKKVAVRFGSNVADEIFLKESKDEKMRRWIINYLDNKALNSGIIQEKTNIKNAIAWLEKQGQKLTLPKWKYKKGHTPLLRDSLILNKYGRVAKSPSGALVSDVWVIDYDELAKLPKEESEKQGEQKPTAIQIGRSYKCISSPRYTCFQTGVVYKPCDEFLCSLMNFCSDCFEVVEEEQNPADKVEPKFKIGDWVFIEKVKGYKQGAFQIKSIDEFGYNFDEYHIIPFMYEELLSKWTIQDAKDGDVLAVESYPFIYSGWLEENKYPFAYCGIISNKSFSLSDGKLPWTHLYSVSPATEEQCDLLFQKMKEAGYEWDAEKKELKKIVQNPIWSEEDDMVLNSILDSIQREGVLEKKRKTDWLKSLKGRVQPQQEWSEEDKEIIEIICKEGDLKPSEKQWLKSLRPQSHWKPSDEQIIELRRVISGCSYDIEPLVKLETKLKEL